MASLTHVCMWSDNGWTRITAEQAAKLHPGGTVSAHSGLFMCELCGQYVSLTDGAVQTRHFRHSAYEKSKNCPERIFGAGYSISYGSQEHDLPIRITGVSSSSFRFEIGLIRAPIGLLSRDFCIEIKPKGVSDPPYRFEKERLNDDRITYLSIGERPFEKYTLNFKNGIDKLREFWPAEITGIDPEGTLFEKSSGKKLTYDADVEIEKEYYLLKRGYFYRRSYSSIRIREIVQKQFGWESWTLYIVSASAFSEEAARFFLDFHCRLTEHPVSLQPVWPLFVEGNYIVKHSQDNMYMLVEGNVATVKTFPSAAVCQLNHNVSYPKLYEVHCSSRQQLISAGRTQALQYTYFWKEPLNGVGSSPAILVTDLSGSEIESGESNTLPYHKTLLFKSTFDGELIISNNRVVDKRKIVADRQLELNGLSYGVSVQLVIGLDVVWEINFKKRQVSIVSDEVEILKRLRNTSGAFIPAPHSLRNILSGMGQYPQICQWIKIPAKADMNQFLQGLHESKHIPNDDDAELITRFEMQQFCPDILITNYSMLEYMLLRPREQKIWNDTREWLASDSENKLLFVIDEAHMYRGSSGGEVALLIRRLFHKLGISRDRVQFILTTASMPNKDQQDVDSVMKFANELTASDTATRFCYLTGEREVIDGQLKYDIPAKLLLNSDPGQFEDRDEVKLSALLSFWRQLDGFDSGITSLESVYNWMYENLVYYRPFHELIKNCRGNAVSLGELSSGIFPELNPEDALKAVSVLLAIAPLAKNAKGSVLFPARMHMLFKGISGIYACTNANCSCSHSEGGLTLGEIYLSDGNLICPHCGSVVYELYNDRRCGALFFKGYVLEDDSGLHGNVYLWHYPGQLMDRRMKEIHLFIPTDDFELPAKQGKNAIRPCYLDVKSGFINFTDDSSAGKPWIRKLYYCNYSAKGRPQIITFPTCPHCRHQLSTSQLTSFNTRGNQSFFNLIKAQFQLQPAVPGKDNDPDRFPNEGRKVLLFSDSRQRAAKLARDMSEASDISAARQLFAIAIKTMEEQTVEQSMNSLYDYFCLVAGQHHVQIFHGPERIKFAEDCTAALNNYNRCVKRGREYAPRFTIANAPVQMQEYLLRLFAGGYNTLYDSATSWIEPTDQALFDAVDALEENNVTVTDEEFINFFNAWILTGINMYMVCLIVLLRFNFLNGVLMG